MAEKDINQRATNFQDITGQTFSRLTVLEFAGIRNRRAEWRCRCTCGNEIVAQSYLLRSGGTKSCGCLKHEVDNKTNLIHGMSDTKTWRAWKGMLGRCTHTKRHNYERYGGRGIAVCERWRDSFENFLADMGECPTGLTLDRIDNDKGYEPGNCRWATPQTQARNRRNNVHVTYQGQTKLVLEWAGIVGIPYPLLYSRLKRMSVEKAMTAPIQIHKQKTE